MKKKYEITRRDLIKQMGFAAFLMHPLFRNMAWAQSNSFQGAPRFIMFFKGASFQPSQMPTSIGGFNGTPLAPLAPHRNDMILFRNMHIHGGSPKSTGYREEHGAGLFGCVTGNIISYTRNDSYFAYTNHESIDIRIAREYAKRNTLSDLPISSLHIGAGAHSDSDSTGLGQRYISYRNRNSGDSTYGNAIEPIQSAGQVYENLIRRINLICSQTSNQPDADTQKLRSALMNKKSVLDLKIKDIRDAQRRYGIDSEHAIKLEGLLDGWRDAEKLVSSELSQLDQTPPSGNKECPTLSKPNGNGSQKKNLDQLSPVYDQMITMVRLAFEWDLTRVVAFTMSGASCGQYLPSRGINSAHHSLEHGGRMSELATVDEFYSEKFALLLSELKKVDDGNGQNALYNSSAVFGMECWSDGGHSLRNIPFMLAGNGAGRFQTGRVVDAGGRSNNDLLISCLQASGVNTSTFGLSSLSRGPIV